MSLRRVVRHPVTLALLLFSIALVVGYQAIQPLLPFQPANVGDQQVAKEWHAQLGGNPKPVRALVVFADTNGLAYSWYGNARVERRRLIDYMLVKGWQKDKQVDGEETFRGEGRPTFLSNGAKRILLSVIGSNTLLVCGAGELDSDRVLHELLVRGRKALKR